MHDNKHFTIDAQKVFLWVIGSKLVYFKMLFALKVQTSFITNHRSYFILVIFNLCIWKS